MTDLNEVCSEASSTPFGLMTSRPSRNSWKAKGSSGGGGSSETPSSSGGGGGSGKAGHSRCGTNKGIFGAISDSHLSTVGNNYINACIFVGSIGWL